MIHLRVQAPHLALSADTISSIENSFGQAFERLALVVREIERTLLDVNGPKGGIDKRCRVQVRLYPRGLVVVQSTGTSVVEAARDACDKARQAVVKRRGKQKIRQHSTSLDQREESALHGN